jgi:ligand-binding SRPBCC domain-containing protein
VGVTLPEKVGSGYSLQSFLFCFAIAPQNKKGFPLLSLTRARVLPKTTSKKMKVYKKETVQHVNATLEQCWAFFSSPANLQKITPESMGFQITDFDQKPMYAGQIIQYKVSPLLGLKLTWVTEITFVKDNSYFIDEQRFGPYVLWHHKHFFEATPNGVKMTDLVHYALPLGFIGRIMNTLIVKNKSKQIFEHRVTKVNEIFNSK